MNPRGLAVFDLDGTLLCGPTVCEVLAAPLGRLDEMRSFERLSTDDEDEIARARVEIARWYEEVSRTRLMEFLAGATWAPGARDGIARLRDAHKAAWLHDAAARLNLSCERIAAVGDSSGDLLMLQGAGLRFFLGLRPPPGLDCVHMPDGNINDVARRIVAAWQSGQK